MSDGPLILIGEAVVTGDGPVILRGGVVLANGRIAAVGPADTLQREFAGATIQPMPGCVLMPGMVNAHTHLELGYMRGKLAPPRHFTQWVADLMANYPPRRRVAELVLEAVRAGVQESLRFGVTMVGDIARHCEAERQALASGPIRGVSFGEVLGLGKMRHGWSDRLDIVCQHAGQEAEHLRAGVSPHAPYTVEGPTLRGIVERARRERMPLAMHLAELAEEREFLESLTGPLGRDWDLMLNLDILDDKIPLLPGGPIRWTQHWGLLKAGGIGTPVLLAHANYVDAADMDIIAASGASVAYCPRTHAFFGHTAAGPHPFMAMRQRGINVCLGTDSLASNPDLSILAEARFLHRIRPDVPASVLLEMLTINGAKALGAVTWAGSLRAGKVADVVALQVGTIADEPSALRQIVAGDGAITAVWIAGQRIVGNHMQ